MSAPLSFSCAMIAVDLRKRVTRRRVERKGLVQAVSTRAANAKHRHDSAQSGDDPRYLASVPLRE